MKGYWLGRSTYFASQEWGWVPKTSLCNLDICCGQISIFLVFISFADYVCSAATGFWIMGFSIVDFVRKLRKIILWCVRIIICKILKDDDVHYCQYVFDFTDLCYLLIIEAIRSFSSCCLLRFHWILI